MYLKINKKWRFTVDILMIIIGTLIMGFAFSVFLEPNNISTGGFSGLSMIINSLLTSIGINFLSTSVIYLLLNIGLFLLALKTLGKKFAIKSIIGIVSFSLGMEIFALLDIKIVYETIISAIYGGALIGLGCGLVVRFGGSTGGSDMIASMVKDKNPRFSIGTVIVGIDMCVVVLSLFTFFNGLELVPYTIIALLISLVATDFINEGYKQVRAFNIVTSKPEEISSVIMEKLSRGCTVTRVTGMHSKVEKYNVLCLVSKFQANYLRRLLKEVDENAFIYSVAVSEVIGEWTKESQLPEEEKIVKIIKSTKKLAKPSKDNPNSQKLESQDNSNNIY